jgi:hypothetical protein
MGHVFHIQKIIGLENIQNAAIHSDLEDKLFNAKGDDFHLADAKTLEEASKLLEIGFAHLSEMDMVKLFMKRK